MQISHPQVAIAGRVLDGKTDKPISGAIVEIKEMPKKFETILSLKKLQYGAQWEKMSDRVDRKITASDGAFYFVDLPEGDYRLKASLPSGGTRYREKEQPVHVSSAIENVIPTTPKDIVKEIIPTSITKIVLEPTGIEGTISDVNPPKKAIVGAKVQIEGSRENTFSNQDGKYSLLALDASPSGQRTVNLIVSATGYQEVSQSLEIKQGEVISDQNFSLEKEQINNN